MKQVILFVAFLFVILSSCQADIGKNEMIDRQETSATISVDVSSVDIFVRESLFGVIKVAVNPNEDRIIQTTDINTLRYANNRNIYAGNGKAGISQYDLNGKKEKQYKIWKEMGVNRSDIIRTEVLWVDNEELFFSCCREHKYFEIWCVPLRKTEEKNRLILSQKERMAKIKKLDCLITKTDKEIVYCADNKICKMNRNTKQEKELNIGDDSLSRVIRGRQRNPFVQDNKIYYNNGKTREMYQLDLESWETVLVGPKTEWSAYLETDGENIYYKSYDSFIKYNVKTGEKVELFSDRKLQEEINKVESQGVIFSNKVVWENMLESYLTTSYYYENRLYLAVQVAESDGYGYTARILFSCLASDGSDFRFEKEITQYLWENSKICHYTISQKEGEGKESYWESYEVLEVTGEFLYFIDGFIVIHFYDEKIKEQDGRHNFVVYDISNKTFREVRGYSEEYGYFKALGFSEGWLIRGVGWYKLTDSLNFICRAGRIQDQIKEDV